MVPFIQHRMWSGSASHKQFVVPKHEGIGILQQKSMAETSLLYIAHVMCTNSTFWLPSVTI